MPTACRKTRLDGGLSTTYSSTYAVVHRTAHTRDKRDLGYRLDNLQHRKLVGGPVGALDGGGGGGVSSPHVPTLNGVWRLQCISH